MAEEYTSPVASLSGSVSAAGAIGVVVARSGVGKTALVVHLGLEPLLRGQQVLHVALRDGVDHARAHWDEVLRAVAGRARLTDPSLAVERGRMIHSFQGRPFDPVVIDRNLGMLKDAAQFEPVLLLIDGFDDLDAFRTNAPALRELVTRRRLRCWITLRSDVDPPADLLGPNDVVVRLVSGGRPGAGQGAVRLGVVHGGAVVDTSLSLDPTTFLVYGEESAAAASGPAIPGHDTPELPEVISARECTLYSGGAAGAEAAFGEAAERWGAHEVNLTFDGHLQARTRGRYELSPKELAIGDVSLAYVSKRLNRAYSDRGGLIRGVLQTLWHMVSRSQQVFVVGQIQDDGTVVGGTGWSVELARMWNRDVWVYDQEKAGWHRWDGFGWAPGTPRIAALHVCGTGTRYLNDDARAAIDALFERSFGRG